MSSINQGAQVLLGSGLPLFTENPRRVRAGNWFPRIHSSPEAQRTSSHSPVRYSCIGPATSGIHRDAERTSSRKLVAVIRATRASARERTRFSCHSSALSEPCGPSRNSCSCRPASVRTTASSASSNDSPRRRARTMACRVRTSSTISATTCSACTVFLSADAEADEEGSNCCTQAFFQLSLSSPKAAVTSS